MIVYLKKVFIILCSICMLTDVLSSFVNERSIVDVRFDFYSLCFSRVTGGELFEDIVAREFYSEADAR
jgi:hypothetical protein